MGQRKHQNRYHTLLLTILFVPLFSFVFLCRRLRIQTGRMYDTFAFIFVAYLTKVTSERRCCFDFVCVCVMNVRIQMTTLQTRRERIYCQWWTQNILACVPSP